MSLNRNISSIRKKKLGKTWFSRCKLKQFVVNSKTKKTPKRHVIKCYQEKLKYIMNGK